MITATTYTHRINIQGNEFEAVQIPTTQDDNHHGVLERYELYQNENLYGKIAIWNGSKFGLVIGSSRFVLDKTVLNVVTEI